MDELKDTMLSMILSIFKECLPILLLYISAVVVFKFVKHLMTPKYDGTVFDDNYADDFDLAYDSLRDMYDSDEDFINDYMSDFTAFQDDEPELDELVEYDMWDNTSTDIYYDNSDNDIYYYNESAFLDNFDDDYTYIHLPYSFEAYDGSYSDYVEHSESE